jgi:tetratricopeptide (TPR) repeat protein
MIETLSHPLHELLERCAATPVIEAKALKLFSAIDHAFRFDALVLLALYLREPPPADEKISGILRHERLSVGAWLELLESLINVIGRGRVQELLRPWFRHHQAAGRFDRLITFRNEYAHGRGSLDPATLAREFDGAERDLELLLGDRPALGRLCAQDGRVHLEAADLSIDCTPFLLPSTRTPGSVLCFSHRSDQDKRVHYSDPLAGGRPEADEAGLFEELASLLDAKGGGFNPRRAPKDGDQARNLRRSFAALTESTLARMRSRSMYRPETFLERAEAEDAFNSFVRGPDRLLVIVGPEGAGKSSFLCHAAQRRLESDGATILLSAERLDGNAFPESLGPVLGLPGKVASRLSHASGDSSDGRVVVMIDDVVSAQGKTKLLDAIVRFIEGAQEHTPLRVVVTMQPAQIPAFLSRHPDDLNGLHVRLLHLPRFSAHEVRLFAKALSLPAPDSSLLEARRKAVAYILASHDETMRRPGLLVRILENADPALVESRSISASAIRAEQFRAACPDRTPRKLIAKLLARRMLDTAQPSIHVEDEELVRSGLLYERDGSPTPDYRVLLDMGFLIEVKDEYGSQIVFATAPMFQYAAAQHYLARDPIPALEELCELSQRFEPAIRVAAQVAVCQLKLLENKTERDLAELSRVHGDHLLHIIAELDRATLLALSARMLQREPERMLALCTALLTEGQPRTADLVLEGLITSGPCSAELLRAARLLRAEALWIVDDYAGVERELSALHERDMTVTKMHAMIATAKGEFASAAQRFDEVLVTLTPGTFEHAEALMCSGPALLGQSAHEKAEARLRTALAYFESVNNERYLAEALHNLGQALAAQDRYDEAETYYARSLALNVEAGTLIGSGIVIGLFGELKAKRGMHEAAKQDLEQALDIARRVDNRWREAWVALRLARVLASQGARVEADELELAATRLYAELGCVVQ